MTLRNIFIGITLICINSPIYSQTDIYQIKQNRPKSIDSILHHRQQSTRERLRPPILIIDNPNWLKYIDVDDIVSIDFFTNMPVKQSGVHRNNNNFTKIMAGVGAGFVVGIAGGYIGYALEGCNGGGEFCGLAGLVIGGLIGYHLGTPYGVYKVGNRNNEDGSYTAALFSGIAGHLVGIAALTILPNTATGIFWFISAPIGATIGYNRSRKFQSNDRQGTSLINLNSGEIKIATPMIYFHQLQSTNRHVQMIDILQIDL